MTLHYWYIRGGSWSLLEGLSPASAPQLQRWSRLLFSGTQQLLGAFTFLLSTYPTIPIHIYNFLGLRLVEVQGRIPRCRIFMRTHVGKRRSGVMELLGLHFDWELWAVFSIHTACFSQRSGNSEDYTSTFPRFLPFCTYTL